MKIPETILFLAGSVLNIFCYLWVVREDTFGYTMQGIGLGMILSSIFLVLYRLIKDKKQ